MEQNFGALGARGVRGGQELAVRAADQTRADRPAHGVLRIGQNVAPVGEGGQVVGLGGVLAAGLRER